MEKETFYENCRDADLNMATIGWRPEGSAIPGFVWRCMGNGCFSDEAQAFARHWEEAGDEEEFIRAVTDDRALACSQGYAELWKAQHPFAGSELPEWWWDAFKPDRTTAAWSDGGSVSLESEHFSANYGYGDDGIFMVYVFEDRKAEFGSDLFKFVGSVEGSFSISGTRGVAEFSGRYGLFARSNILVMQRWS